MLCCVFVTQADVYVNTASDSLNLRQGAVAASFLKAGGSVLQDECSAYVAQNGKVPIGEVVVTGPGSVHCKKIIHTVGPVYDGKRSEKVNRKLSQFTDLQVLIVSFPLIDLARSCLEVLREM